MFDDVLEQARQIKYAAVATVSDQGLVWNTPVAVFYDQEGDIYWASWQDNQHSHNVRNIGQVFITVFDSTPGDGPQAGVYVHATATELNGVEEVNAAAKVFEGDPYNPSDGSQYMDSFPRRIYRAVPVKVWINGDQNIDGNFVDYRREVPLEDYRRVFGKK